MDSNVTVDVLLEKYRPRICSFAYVFEKETPIVCNMGFALYDNQLILHTSTWTYKWRNLIDGQKASLAIGFDHLSDYAQVFGTISKISSQQKIFPFLEDIYLQSHPEAVHYRKGQEGILLIAPYKVRIGSVSNRKVVFEEYIF